MNRFLVTTQITPEICYFCVGRWSSSAVN